MRQLLENDRKIIAPQLLGRVLNVRSFVFSAAFSKTVGIRLCVSSTRLTSTRCKCFALFLIRAVTFLQKPLLQIYHYLRHAYAINLNINVVDNAVRVPFLLGTLVPCPPSFHEIQGTISCSRYQRFCWLVFLDASIMGGLHSYCFPKLVHGWR